MSKAAQRPTGAAGARQVRRSGPPRSELPGLAARRTAAALLRRVFEGGVPLDALLDESHGYAHFRRLDARDRALVRAILGVALRRRGEIQAAIAAALKKPLPEKSGSLTAILHVGAAQILFLDVPDHAVVNLAVTHALEDRTTRNARGLVNSVLRRIARERTELLAGGESGRRNAPDWLFERWAAAYGEDTAAAIAEAHLAPPDLDLTVKSDAPAWAERLGGTLLPNGTIRLPGSHRVSALPGYPEGAWWVQDFAASFPARLLGEVAGKRVADLCAAPGGKTAQLASAGAEVVAVDISPNRLERLGKNLGRLRLPAELVSADITTWQHSERFDAILLDAPCSATGTIRRHPDVQWLKRPEDIAALAALQQAMLDRASAWLRPGGTLVFCTCSLEAEEGELQLEPFLATHPEFRLEPIRPDEIGGLDKLVTQEGLLRTLPCHGFGPPLGEGMDGFFAARLRHDGAPARSLSS